MNGKIVSLRDIHPAVLTAVNYADKVALTDVAAVLVILVCVILIEIKAGAILSVTYLINFINRPLRNRFTVFTASSAAL